VTLKLPVAGIRSYRLVSINGDDGSRVVGRQSGIAMRLRDAKPKTLTELAALSGRQVPNLSRTLRMMEGYGLIELKRNVREIEPIARATDFLVVLDSPQGERK